MRYVSTRGQAPLLGFEEAMMAGLARDGGLYVPEAVPVMSEGEIAALAGLSYEDTAYRVMRPFVGDAFGDAEFRGLIGAAYRGFGHAARAPLVQEWWPLPPCTRRWWGWPSGSAVARRRCVRPCTGWS